MDAKKNQNSKTSQRKKQNADTTNQANTEVKNQSAPSFNNIKFNGTFREYQQRVIDSSIKHLKDKRIHIVASPGSGKTILGLELIRMLGDSALILSPTIAIREQWKERFEQMFVPSDENVDKYVSCSLFKPKLLTSITYQGLYTSYRKISPAQRQGDRSRKANAINCDATDLDDEAQSNDSIDSIDGDTLATQIENYSTVDIIQLMKKHKITTLCLDEAHHLRAEWQKALTEFVLSVEHSVTIIALTATPPYDSKKSEWDKYITLCGPIDEEIFVPELVRAKNLCPHQDYIYYNFPTDNEASLIEKYQETVETTLDSIFESKKFLEIITGSDFYKDPDEYYDELSENPEFVKSLLAFLEESEIKPPKTLLKCLEHDDRDIDWDLSVAEILFQEMINNDLFSIKDREFVKKTLGSSGLVDKNKVCLITNPELEKLLFSSIGKLSSISNIVDKELSNLGEKIRLLVLTDYIKVNSSTLGSDKEISELGVVPIFELLRRKKLGLKLSAISGKIVIVPSNSIDEIMEIAKADKIRIKAVEIAGTEHCELRFEGGDSAQKISIVTKAFNKGIINGIIGTKSLLGEGWDSPVINTLILASCVGSFMLSNQMRGRAIRIDKNCPDKVSNIWHLTAILPDYLMPDVGSDLPPSADYATLERRFHGFMGLSYEDDTIESSLKRANTLSPPYTKESIDMANEKTFELANDRTNVAKRWHSALANSGNEVIIQNEIPKPKKGFIPAFIIRPSHYSTIKKTTHAILKTFKTLNIIGKKAKPVIDKDYKNKTINVGICRCTQYEKSIFHQAVSETLSPIDNPKYILIKTKETKIDYRASFAVPAIFSNIKENAEVFMEKMSRRIARFGLYFTRSIDGKKNLASAKKKAYINKTNNEIQAKMKLKQN